MSGRCQTIREDLSSKMRIQKTSKLLLQCCSRAGPLFGRGEVQVPSKASSLAELTQIISSSPLGAWTLQGQQLHGLHTCHPALAFLEIKIQSMGESITEGTVAEILKREDEPVLQIETDKVTIDLRAPEAGVLTKLLVKVDETVETGQTVAFVDTSTEAGTAQPLSPAPEASAPAKERPCTPELESEEHTGRQPSIRFPSRHTPSGQRISALSAGEQAQFHEGEAKSSAAEASPPARPSSPGTSVAADGGTTTSLRRALKSTSSSASRLWYAGKERGTKLNQSQVLSDREMETIELGGAAP